MQFWFQTIAQIICVAWKCFVKWAAKKQNTATDVHVTVMMISCILAHEASAKIEGDRFMGNNKHMSAMESDYGDIMLYIQGMSLHG